jgi:RNA polymerase sigma-70 factor (ECF subfamily)
VGRNDDDPSDRRLAQAAAQGDRTALDVLLARHVDRVHAVCRRVLGNEQDALDATQEALIAITRGIGSFDGRAQFTTWAYRVATNAALDEARRRARRPLPAESLPDRAESPHDVADRVADAIDVDAALAAIPVEYRAAVALRDLAGLDYAEIAAVLELPAGTVRSRIARGRAALADRLADRDSRLGNSGDTPGRPTHRTP